MPLHRRRVASLAMTMTMLGLALGCTPVALPTFDDGKNSGVGGFNGGTGGTGGTGNQTTDPTPTPSPSPTPEVLNYGTITWQRAGDGVLLTEPVTFTAGAVVNNAFVVTGGIRQAIGLSRLTTSFAIGGNGSLSAGVPLSAVNVNGVESGICSHGAYVFDNNLVLAGGQSDALQFQSNGVSILRGGNWFGAVDTWPTATPINGARQDFGYAQDDTYIFVVGGRTGPSTATGLATDSILVADASPTGEVSNWRVAGTLPAVTLWPAATVANNRLYVYGGRTDTNGTVLNTVTSYAIGSNGLLSDQQAETNEVESGGTLRPQFGSAAYARNNRVYFVGGMDTAGQYATSYVSVTRSNGRLAPWRTDGALPDRVGQAAYASDGNGHFFLGGGAYEAGLTGGSTEITNRLWYATVTD